MFKLIIVIVLVIGAFVLFKDKSTAPINIEQTENIVSEVAEESNVKEFSVNGSNFAFAPKTITVNKGDTIKITFKNTLGMHDLKIDEFAAATKILKAGESETITFVADKTGTFEYYCSVGTHRQMGMVGKLIVD